MSINKLSVILIIFALSSCDLLSKPSCKSIVISDGKQLDSIASGLDKFDAVNAFSLRIKGTIDKDITLHQFQLPAGKIDTITEPFDYYGPNFIYKINNPDGAKGDLELCVTFYH
ncbi:hypothetical protein ACPUEN_16095 [Algoriphagus yeomjeoni]|uniref:hypothetical protein n=1 Tax=Algoriphagus yeomjeoni TaxID=291403 RepID=UPI003CE5ABC7